ncbi:peptide/nickel transport system ATP-binding protein [Leucobacter komagatae]|uniref:Peptide/nickel transport system ATP-binding protein n=1 Tax=Leucobacter komagatae TaxID=55969 RepID=A0A542Y5I7_9MICO|nr:ATP-binding cassette domain-containing protein [Leucobacter komagatae]TQL43305.1 peptide/nickel transport system ATP-binding protein [Leucobacter komagatae]
MITCERLTVGGAAGAERPVLRNLNARIEHGRVRAVVGGKGAGKTVLGWALRGALCPGLSRTAGSVRLGDFDPLARAATAEAAGHVAWLSEDAEGELRGAATVRDALASALTARFPGIAFDDLTLCAALARLGINDPKILDRDPELLPAGLRRRVALAQAVARPASAGSPKLVVLDEPLAGLERPVADEVIDALAGMRRAIRTTVIVLTRDLELAQRFADEISVLENGQIVETFCPERAARRANGVTARPLARGAGDAPVAEVAGATARPRAKVVAEAAAVTRGTTRRAKSGPLAQGPLAAPAALPALELRNFAVTLPGALGATPPVSVALQRGGGLAITGPTGSGKSMLALALVGGVSPSSALRIGGDLRIDGALQESRAAARTAAERRAIQLVTYSTERASSETHTVRTLLRRAVRRARPAVSPSAVGSRVSELLALVALGPDRLLVRVCDLSRAEQLRLALARALAHDPRVLVLDGGETGEAEGSAEFFAACARARRSDGVALLSLSRDADALGECCDAEMRIGGGSPVPLAGSLIEGEPRSARRAA